MRNITICLGPIIVYLSVLLVCSLSGCSDTVGRPKKGKNTEDKPHPAPVSRIYPNETSPEEPLPLRAVGDSIFVDKSDRKMTVFHEGETLKTYRVALGACPIGPKRQQGDNRTPEGLYQIDGRVKQSTCHLALHISYPGPADQRWATGRRVSPGGDIMIHGLPNGQGSLGRQHLKRDWTFGCIAVTDQEIEELWRAVPDGTPIYIQP